jgi:hypothetical protein
MDIKKAIEDAGNLRSKITPEAMTTMEGLSSPRVRHLLNNLASQAKSYLEIGCYLGGTLRAALHGNNHLYAAAVDNFSMSPETREQFFKNTEGLNFDFFEEDSFSMDITKIKQPIELYFFDGCHSVESQYKAVSYFLDAMADEFVIIIDDWDMNKVRVGTHTALIDRKIKPLEKYELRGASGQSDDKRKEVWWGGLGIFKIKK